MNDNIDDWLNPLGISNIPTPEVIISSSGRVTVGGLPIVPEPPQLQEPINLTASDLDEILQENSFEAYQEAEEVSGEDDEESGEEEVEVNTDESPVDTAIRELDEEIQAVQSVNDEDYPEHNPDEDQEAEAPEVSESSHEPLIPANSPTLLMDDSTSRFSGTEWYNKIKEQQIIVAGIGGIGSWLTFQLARMQPSKMVIYDDDRVEAANMSGQLFSFSDIGRNKVEAVYSMIHNYTHMPALYTRREKFTPDTPAGNIMMCGFDNMEARKVFFERWRDYVRSSAEDRARCLFLDGRLSIDTIQIFCITGDNDWAMNEYMEKYLFSDAEADSTVCSLKQTTYLACMIGSLMVNLFTNFVADLCNPAIPYDLPFFTEYDAQNMIFKTES